MHRYGHAQDARQTGLHKDSAQCTCTQCMRHSAETHPGRVTYEYLIPETNDPYGQGQVNFPGKKHVMILKRGLCNILI